MSDRSVSSPQSHPKKGYRYVVTAVEGTMADRMKPGTFVVDWTYFGRSHTWEVFNTKTWDWLGSWTGKYVDKGVMVDGKYEPETT